MLLLFYPALSHCRAKAFLPLLHISLLSGSLGQSFKNYEILYLVIYM